MNTPFSIVPWDTDFLAALHLAVNESTDHHPERAVIVFPHERPRRYLLDHFQAEKRSLLLPRMLSVKELFATLRPAAPVREAGLIDRIALLLDCCREVAHDDATLSRRLLRGGEAAFFPWGERLAGVLEECLTQNMAPLDLHHAETEVAPFAADLLTALGRIFARYVTLLPEQGRTTPGLDAYTAALRLRTQPDAPLPPLLAGRQIFLAGFHTLTGTEECVLRHLWQCGASVLLHSDPALAEGRTAHWSCAGHARWIAKWNAATQLACPPAGRIPRLRFFAGHDVHSQLEQLTADLDGVATSAAVALTHPELLLPVLHHLPNKDCNISLGYPLERTQIHRLLDTVLTLAEQRTPDGLTNWRALSELIAHPWVQRLHPATPSGPERHPDASGFAQRSAEGPDTQSDTDGPPGTQPPFAELLHLCDRDIRNGSRLQHPDTMASRAIAAWSVAHSDAAPAQVQALTTLLDTLLERTIRAWSRARTLGDMADCLAELTELLAVHGADLWHSFPLDAECLARIVLHIIPPLRDNGLADTPLAIGLRHTMLRTLLRSERVPFEADPITGLQVLGMLETRLLRFDRVFIVDATDDALPGPPGHDPLLPDSLRGVLGLPDAHQRELLAAHTFHRLLAGANEVCLYWQEGGSPSGLLDAAKQRSRLIEALIWREEQRRGRLLELGEPPLYTPVLRLRPPRRSRLCLPRTPAMRTAVATMLAKGLTPARLDAYLSCPLAFYYGYIARLGELETVNEGDDPAAVGELLHAVLHEALTPWKNRILRRGDLQACDLDALFAARLASSGLPAALPPESAVMLELAGPMRLHRFLAAAPEVTTIRHLETDLHVAFSAPDVLDGTFPLRGRADRIDERDEVLADPDSVPGRELYVLDYKTGRARVITPDVWADSALWTRLRTWLAKTSAQNAPGQTAPLSPVEDGTALLADLAACVPSVQLPCYIAMLDAQPGATPRRNAAWVELGDSGVEYPLFPPAMTSEARHLAVTHQIPLLLAFIIGHMRDASDFPAREGTHCSWCLFKNLCMITE